MALKLIDRLLTVAVTATLTSAAWIVILSGTERESSADEELPSVSSARPASASSASSASAFAGRAMLVPVAGIEAEQLVDTFADARGGGSRSHQALDIPAPAGTAVLAAGPGIVEKLFLSDEGGNTVYVRSADRRTLHYYAHLQDYAAGLREGQQVERGQRLGSVGSSGNADPAAPHLHFAILSVEPDADWWEPGRPINPYRLLRAGQQVRQAGDRNR